MIKFRVCWVRNWPHQYKYLIKLCDNVQIRENYKTTSNAFILPTKMKKHRFYFDH